MQPLVLLIAVSLTTWLALEAIRRLAMRVELLDRPNDRSSHHVPTPRLGGVALVLTLTVAGWWLFDDQARRVTFALAAGLAVVSLIDDLRGLPALVRLSVHIGVAVAATWLLGPLWTLHVAGHVLIVPSAVAWGLPVLWFAGFINAFNFMDGSDGIAGSQALVAFLGWVWLAPAGSPVGMFAAIGAAAMVGFLLQNWAPARIFMGDVGSAYLGFVLASLPWLSGDAGRLGLLGGLLVWPFVFDTAFTLCARAARGANILQAHREHLYQRLLRQGRSHPHVAMVYGGLSMSSSASALMAARTGTAVAIGVASAVCATMAVALVAFVRRLERRRPAAG